MSTAQRQFIRQAWLIIIAALVAQALVGFGVLNKDHFTIKQNGEKIRALQVNDLNYIHKADFMEYMKLLAAKNDILERALVEHREHDAAERADIRAELRDINDRIATIMMNYSQRGGVTESILN